MEKGKVALYEGVEVHLKEEGYVFKSDKTGKEYELMEMMSTENTGSKTLLTSDIGVLFYYGNIETDEESEIIGHFWGVSGTDKNFIIEKCIDIITKYERCM